MSTSQRIYAIRFLKCYTQWLGWDNRVKKFIFDSFSLKYSSKAIKKLGILTGIILFLILYSTTFFTVTFPEK